LRVTFNIVAVAQRSADQTVQTSAEEVIIFVALDGDIGEDGS